MHFEPKQHSFLLVPSLSNRDSTVGGCFSLRTGNPRRQRTTVKILIIAVSVFLRSDCAERSQFWPRCHRAAWQQRLDFCFDRMPRPPPPRAASCRRRPAGRRPRGAPRRLRRRSEASAAAAAPPTCDEPASWFNYTELVPEYSHLLPVFKIVVNILDRFIIVAS